MSVSPLAMPSFSATLVVSPAAGADGIPRPWKPSPL
jgi:hypothetical protein